MSADDCATRLRDRLMRVTGLSVIVEATVAVRLIGDRFALDAARAAVAHVRELYPDVRVTVDERETARP